MNQKPNSASNHNNNNNNNNKMDYEIRNLISSLTRHVTNLSKQASGSDQGGGIITLAGSNKGAVMKAEFNEDALVNNDDDDMTNFGEDDMNTYTNSNYQAINNSILIDGVLEAEDPGVHIEIVDSIDDEDGKGKKKKDKKKDKEKKGKKGKTEEKIEQQE